MSKMQSLVFTDMDGTLLDHYSYDFSPASPTLAKLSDRGIPVIPTTSKTYAELIELRKTIGLTGPFIVENGAAIYIPHGFFAQKPTATVWQDGFWCHSFIQPRQYWLKVLEYVAKDFVGEFSQFSTMTTEDIQDCTGLSSQEAERAARRQYGEPLLWHGSDERKREFIQAVKKRGAYPLEGGRFIHISGDCNKGVAMNWLVDEFERQRKVNTQSIALGDGKNDIAMLDAASIAVRIASPTHTPPELQKQDQVYTSTLLGPEGWTEMLTQILSLES